MRLLGCNPITIKKYLYSLWVASLSASKSPAGSMNDATDQLTVVDAVGGAGAWPFQGGSCSPSPLIVATWNYGPIVSRSSSYSF